MADLEESLKSLLQKRDLIQTARGAFGPVSVYYPNAHPTPRQQEALFNATHDFFHTYYSAVSALLSVIRRHADTFGEAPTHSIARFLTWWKPKGLFMEDAYPLLEKARAFRAFLDHKESHPPYTWQTVDNNGLTKIMLVGSPNAKGGIPEGTAKHPTGWAIMAPDEDLVVSALAVQLNALIPEIGANADIARALNCTWEAKATADDVGHGYPVFAHREVTVSDIYKRTVTTQVTVERQSAPSDEP
ncbi:hypothetical protein FFF93_001555 [Arthrobacter sp. KBS0702]|uniref:hypothetical protein n=1 Tax=Arthrobacter sp. KBS0702 TaxID=2578107 RepID=UPI00110DB8FD|nr:hypothetical protein [Arthrobacter sp. KBS0702]QDW28615.1 hypothetical protein FFF93_001555 [Arthrobacter sp. KBS0702]